jgi:hypothetical protein
MSDAAESALIAEALLVRDMRAAIREAIRALNRNDPQAARVVLKQAIDEMPWPQRNRERELPP